MKFPYSPSTFPFMKRTANVMICRCALSPGYAPLLSDAEVVSGQAEVPPCPRPDFFFAFVVTRDLCVLITQFASGHLPFFTRNDLETQTFRCFLLRASLDRFRRFLTLAATAFFFLPPPPLLASDLRLFFWDVVLPSTGLFFFGFYAVTDL